MGVGLGAGFGVSFLLLNPKVKMFGRDTAGEGTRLGGWAGAAFCSMYPLDRRGGCGGGVSSCKLLLLGLEGSLGAPPGLDGNFGRNSFSIEGDSCNTSCADFTLINGIVAALFNFAFSSTSLRLGGRGGSLASDKGGGNFLVSVDDALVAEDACPKDMPEIVELYECVEEFEPRRTI